MVIIKLHLNIKKGLFILSFFCVWALANAQAPEFKFQRIGVNEGLSQVSIRCILQDNQNFMWFGTDYGLNKYDGYNITIYKIDLQDQGSNIIVCLYEDSKKNLWVGTLNGLYRYDRDHDKFISYKHDPTNNKSISANGVQTIFEDNDGNLWISTFNVLTNKGSLNIYDNNNGFNRKPNALNGLSGVGDNIINCFYEEKNGNLWLGLNKGLTYYNKEKKTFTRYDEAQLKNKSINAIIKDKKDNLWIATDANGIIVLDKAANISKHYTYNPNNTTGLGSSQIFTLIIDKSGKIWAAAGDGGLHLYNPEQDNFFHYTSDEKDPSSLSQDIVRTIYEDRSGIIWVGIFKSGINFFSPYEKNIKHYKKDSRPGGLSANKVKAFCEDHNGTIWVGTDGGGLNRFNKDKNFFTTYKPTSDKRSIGSDAVLDIFEDSYNNLWIGTWNGGLNLLDRETNTFKHYYHNPDDHTSIGSNNVWCMIEDHNRNLWVATFSEGLNVFDRAKNNFSKVPCYLKNEKSRIMCLAIDNEGFIWVGTNSSGVGVLDPSTKKFVRQFQNNENVKASLSSNGIYNIFIDSKNRKWIATDRGINLYNSTKNNFTTWQISEGLPHDVVVGILEDGKGNLWISTLGGGLTKFNPETQAFSNFSMTDELYENKFLESACMKSKNGEMYFGGIDGFNVFHPDSIRKNNFIPPVYFTDFQIFNKSVKVGEKNSPLKKHISQTKEITLSYKQSGISFEFTALNYMNSKKNQYAYKLEGFDEDWNYIGTKRSASYTNLNAGEYTLHVKASNDDGVWNEKGSSIKLIITPPFWKTWWAYTLYGIISVFALYMFREYSIIHIKERNKLIIERLENKKIAEITEAKMRFFTNISHEIRTPLTLISGPLETVLKQEVLTSSAKKNLSSVSRNVKRLLGLANQLLQFRKLDLGFLHLNASETSIVTLLKELLDYFEQHASLKNVDIIIENQLSEEKNLWLDREMITTVFYNLLANAIKYTQPGGHITIKIFEGSMPGLSIADTLKEFLSFNKKSNSIAVEVSDTGKGIPTKELKNIFRRFYQVNDTSVQQVSGSGLGLSLVKEYVELHKGFIEVHSKVQHGTSFTIYFPKELKIEKRKPEPSILYTDDHIEAWMDKEIDLHADKRKDLPLVLIVEDDHELLNFLRESLLKTFRVDVADNGKTGLEKALKIFPDLIISDIAMPEMDGYTLCKEIKSNIAVNHIPVILLTAKALEEDIVLGYNLGADAYIPKPFNVAVVESQGKSLIKSRVLLREKYKTLLLTEPSEITEDSADEKFLKQLMEITEGNIEKQNFDVPTLATEMNMSHSALFRKVKALTGLSIVEFIKSTRLKRAAMILKKERLTVSEVSYRVGFSDLSYFSKCFTKEFGKTPSEYLNEM